MFAKKGFITFLFSCFIAGSAFANPTGGVVSSGDATITQSANQTTIQQNSQKAIINWQSFNIGANEKTHFEQPQGGIALNRINATQGPSQIYGQLTATGKIILVNQAGIFFGPGSYVNVGGIIASTSNISDQNFLAGKFIFDQPSAFNGTVINKGTIIAATNGLVALIGNNVSNDGMIQAELGNVVLASGNKFTIDLYGDQLINFTVDEGIANTGTDENGNPMKNAVANTGTILADGGHVLMTASAAEGVVDQAINMSGVAQAHSADQQNGEIILSSDAPEPVIVSGLLDASGAEEGQTGGTVEILGKEVGLFANAKIDVTGDQGGGTALVGGNAHGAGPEQNADYTYVSPNAVIDASALTNGNGGEVVVWSNSGTQFYGNIFAKGGTQSGNGGWVETSGHYYLNFDGDVDVAASHGTTGTLLLDPENLTIQITGPTTATATGTPTNTFTSNVDNSVLTVNDLESALGSANVLVQTGSGGSQNGDITVADPVTWSTTNSLTLTASKNITLNSNGLSPIISNSSSGSLTLNAPSGIITLNGGINLASGTLTLNALPASSNSSSISIANAVAGTSEGGAISVANFVLTQGGWDQVGSSTSWPTFNITNSFALSGSPSNNNAQFIRAAGGSGTTLDPYQLIDVYGLQGIGSSANTMGYSYILNNNINASSTSTWNSAAGFIPIGGNLLNFGTNVQFNNTFNGSGHTIDQLYIDTTQYPGFNGSNDTNFKGLFANLGTGSLIENVGLTNISFKAFQGYIGPLAFYTSGDITNSYATGGITVTGYGNYVGGLVGESQCSSGTCAINNSYSRVTIDIPNSNGFTAIGGLVGYSDSFNMQNDFSTGAISVGGVGGGFYVGGLIGRLFGNVILQDLYSTSPISLTTTGSNIGGLIGNDAGTNATIENNYYNGSISAASATDVGGLIGDVADTSTIQNNFVSSTVSGSSNVGQLIGKQDVAPTYTSNYWDSTVNSSGNGIGTDTVGGGGGGRSTADMQTDVSANQSQPTFVGWDFSTPIWTMVFPSNISGLTYPHLNMENAYGIEGTATNGTTVSLYANTSNTSTGTATYNTLSGNYTYGLVYRPYELPVGSDILITDTAHDANLVFQTNGSTATAANLTVGDVIAGVTGGAATSNTILSGAQNSFALYSVSGNNLTVNSGKVFVVNSAYTMDGNISGVDSNFSPTFGGALTVDTNNSTLTSSTFSIAGAITLNKTLTLDTTSPTTITSLISGSGGLTIASGSTITLNPGGSGTGINSFTGATTVNGTLSLESPGALGNATNYTSGISILSGGVLDFNFSSGTFSLPSTVAISLLGNGSGNGGITFTGTNIIINNPINLQDVGGVTYTGIGGSGSVNLTGQISGTVYNNNGLNIYGPGTITLSNPNNNFTTQLVVQNGTVILGNAGALPNNVGIEIDGTGTSGGTLDLNGFDTTQPYLDEIGSEGGVVKSSTGSPTITLTGSGLHYYFGTIQDAINLTINGSSLLYELENANNSFSGLTRVESGTLALRGDSALSPNSILEVDSGAAFTTTIFFSQYTGIAGLTGSGTVTLDGNIFTVGEASGVTENFSGTLSGSSGSTAVFIKEGLGTQILSGDNSGFSTTFGFTVNGGTLEAKTNTNALGTVGVTVNTGGTLELLDYNGATFSNPFQLLGGTLLAANSGSGSSTTISGTVALNNNSIIDSQSANDTLDFTNVISNLIGNTGAITKDGAGTVTFSNANTYSGGTSINDGTLIITNSSALGAAAATVGAGTLELNGSALSISNPLTLNNGSTLSDIGSSGDVLTGGIALDNSGDVGSTTSETINVAANQTLTLNSVGLSGGSPGGSANNTLNINSSGSGEFAINIAPTSSLLSLFNVDSGTLQVGADNVLGTVATNILTLIYNSVLQSSGSTTLPNNFAVNNALASIAGANDLTLSGSATLNADFTVNNSAGTITLSGAIGDNGAGYGITKSGAGTLILSNTSNAYTGTTNINDGIVSIPELQITSSQSPLGSSNIFINGGTLDDTVSTTDTASRNIEIDTNGGTIEATNANGKLNLSGYINGTGTLTLNASGILNLSSTLDGGNPFIFQGSGTINLDTPIGVGVTTPSVTSTVATLGINASSITTTGAQSYGNIILGPTDGLSVQLGDPSNGTITFNGAIDSTHGSVPQSLEISNGTGIIVFDGAIGAHDPLASLAVQSNSATTIANNITTTGSQTFVGPMTLGGNSILTSNSGDISLQNTVDGGSAYSLSLVGGANSSHNFVIYNAITNTTSFSVNGGNGTSVTDTLDFSHYTSGVDITLSSPEASPGHGFSGTSTFANMQFDNIDAINNNSTTSHTLTGGNNANTWTITGVNSGTYASTNSLAFSGFTNLAGSSTSDSFILNGGTLNGSITGGSGTESLTGDNVANTWTITGTNSGTVTGVTGGFSSIDNLIGGTDGNTFTLSGGTLSGSITGGSSGSNSLQANNVANTWNITGTNAGTVTGVGAGFSNIQNLIGNASDDTFTFSPGGSVTSVDGGTGGVNQVNYNSYGSAINFTIGGSATGITTSNSNITSLVGSSTVAAGTDNSLSNGSSIDTNWTVSGTDSGSVDSTLGSGLTFSNIGELIADSILAINTFSMTNGNVVGNTGVDKIVSNVANANVDYSNFGNAVTLILTNIDNNGNTSGSATNIGSFILDNFDTITLNQTGGNTVNIDLPSGGSYSGRISSLGQNNAINASGYGAPLTINLSANTTSFGNISGFDNFTGTDGSIGSANSTLVGPTAFGTINWAINAVNGGTVDSGVTKIFSGFGNITANGSNTFVFTGNGYTNEITGGTGRRATTNTLDFSGLSGTLDIQLSGVTSSGVSGSLASVVPTFSNVNSIVGNNNSNTALSGVNSTSNQWTISSANSGNYVSGSTSLAFSDFQNLQAGNAGDTFTINAALGTPTLSGNIIGGSGNDTFIFGSGGSVGDSISGGAGTNTLNYSNYGNASVNLQFGTASGIGGSFSGINSAIANSSYTNTLTGGDGANTFNITGTNAGTVNALTNGFSGFNNLVGSNDGINTFNIESGAKITGSITGGNTVNPNLITFIDNVAMNLTVDSTGNGSGNVNLTSNSSHVVNSFNQIQSATELNASPGYITLPSGNTYTIHYDPSSRTSGTISDPFGFVNFIIGNPPIPPTPTSTTNTPANISNIIISGTPTTTVPTAFDNNNQQLDELLQSIAVDDLQVELIQFGCYLYQ